MMSIKTAWWLCLPAWLFATTTLLAFDRIEETLTFDVLLNDKPIGSHTFLIRDEEDRRIVNSEATFDVRVLFVPVYAYRHSNVEVWRDGCLRQIDAETDSNGKAYRVDGIQVDEGFRLDTQSSQVVYDERCLMSFAYWDQEMLSQEKLLNAQTGELVDVAIEPLGKIELGLQDESIVADAFRITSASEDVDILVSYEPETGRWLSLESKVDEGRVLRYVPSADARLAMLNRTVSPDDARGTSE